LDLAVVIPDNDAPTFAARPRAPFATPETAAIGDVLPQLEPPLLLPLAADD
jgi:hypothetical protein